MASSSGGEPGGLISGINVTPLVDVTLVLLVIFMVTAKLVIAPSSTVPVNLPHASSGDAVAPVFAVTLTREGMLSVNGAAIAGDAALEGAARSAHAAHPDLRAVIQAAGEAPHRRVIHVLDVLAKSGVSEVAFAVVPEAPSR